MTGRGTNVNKKRHSSQPPGGAAKDSIAEAEAEEDSPLQINANANVDDSSTWSQVAGRGGRRGQMGWGEAKGEEKGGRERASATGLERPGVC